MNPSLTPLSSSKGLKPPSRGAQTRLRLRRSAESALIGVLAIPLSGLAGQESYPDKVVAAIYQAEGGRKSRNPYGVKWHSWTTKGVVAAKQECRRMEYSR